MPRAANDHDITRALGLSRPLGEYAPRTQRRYRAAYREGLSREEALGSERRARLGQQIKRTGLVNQDGPHDKDNLDRLADNVGGDTAERMLREQLHATQVYKETGSTAPGRQIQGNRNILTSSLIDLAPYTFYHPV